MNIAYMFFKLYWDFEENNSIVFKKLVSFCALIIACADYTKFILKGYCAPGATSCIFFFFLSKELLKIWILQKP